MAIESINMNKALSSQSYAAQAVRSGKLTAAQRGQLVAKWGADLVNKWSSVDTNDYVIEDDKKEAAKEQGKKNAQETTGYDGGKSHKSVGSAIMGAATGAMALGVGKIVGKAITNRIGSTLIKEGAKKGAKTAAKNALGILATGKVTKKGVANGLKKLGTGEGAKKAAQNIGDVLTILMASATMAKYFIEKPNKEQYEAICKIMQESLPDAQQNLTMAQESMQLATEETTTLSEEADELNEAANEDIEENKTMMDFYKAQYDALIEKAHAAANGGEPLTEDEKALLQKLSPILLEIADGINETNEETSDEVNELYDGIEQYQEQYDSGAETIAEVQGLTDYAEGFDESTKTMCYVEGIGQGINGAGAGIAAGKLGFKNLFGIFTPFIVMGAAVAATTGMKIVPEQMRMASEIGAEIGVRGETQDLGLETQDVYDEELENFVGNLETVEDLEIEIPEDLETPPPEEAAEAVSAANANNNGNAGGAMFTMVNNNNNNGQENGTYSPLTGGSEGNTATGGTSGTYSPLTGGTGGNTAPTASNTTPSANGTPTTTGVGQTGGTNPAITPEQSGETRADGTTEEDNDKPGVTDGWHTGNTSVTGTRDSAYVSAMGNGSDWHEIASGNIKRNSDDDIVTDKNGKVVLTPQYAKAITSVTGAKEGEFFSKDDIPKILEKVLGSPFDEKMIKKVHNGKKLDSEYTAKILGTKNQDEKGTGTVDNTEKATALAKKVIDFYWPIFEKASEKGWVKG